MKMKFQDMPCGQHFTDGERKFIKLQNKTATGGLQFFMRHIVNDSANQSRLPFNSVDYEGFAANCPEWHEFNLLA